MEYPFKFNISRDALRDMPPMIKGEVDQWLARCQKRVHDELMKNDFVYRLWFESWEKAKKAEKEGAE